MSVTTIESMVNWVEENILEEPSLDNMSASVGYSSYYCSNKFHEYVGVSFKEYVAKRKLCLATNQIRNTKRRIIDIALEYGFSTHEAFTRAFVKNYGCTPNQYRKSFVSIVLYEKPNFVD